MATITTRHLNPAVLFTAALILFSGRSAAGSPAVNVGISSADRKVTVTIDGSGFPEIKNARFICSYNPLTLKAIDAVISSPVPATALSALLDTSGHTLAIVVNAASTVTITEGMRIVNLRIPTDSRQQEFFFTVDTALLIDKNGTSISAVINPSMIAVRRSFPGSAQPLHQAPAPPSDRVYLLDGRRIAVSAGSRHPVLRPVIRTAGERRGTVISTIR